MRQAYETPRVIQLGSEAEAREEVSPENWALFLRHVLAGMETVQVIEGSNPLMLRPVSMEEEKPEPGIFEITSRHPLLPDIYARCQMAVAC